MHCLSIKPTDLVDVVQEDSGDSSQFVEKKSVEPRQALKGTVKETETCDPL